MRPGRLALCALYALVLSALPAPAAELPDKGAVLADRAFSGSLISGIRRAKGSILCAYYLFHTGHSRANLPLAVARELIAARRRGVEVTVILEGKEPVGRDNRRAGRLLAGGGVKVLFPSGAQVSHLKAMVIDDRLVLLGSHNLTQAALTRNNELSVIMESPALAREVRGYLERLSAHAVTFAAAP